MLSVREHSPSSEVDLDRRDGARPPLRVMVVDDHTAVRLGVLQLLEDQPDMVVVEAVSSAEVARALAEREPIDVAVVDYQLGSRSGLWLTRMLKRLERPPAVLIYSAYCDGPLAAACVVAGADGLISKGGAGAELCEAVRAVARGRSRLPVVPPALAGAMRRRLGSEEQAIFGMLLAGIEAPDIAATLGISPRGLESRSWAMLHKLEALRPEPDRARAKHARVPRRRAPGC
jgi:DNA-binding NarL/FixJ family response regulator